jgi:hypothetical protein
MQVDYLWSEDNRLHAINCKIKGTGLEVGIVCAISFSGTTVRISNEHHSLIVEVPYDIRSGSERVKAFNVVFNILNHEQV